MLPRSQRWRMPSMQRPLAASGGNAICRAVFFFCEGLGQNPCRPSPRRPRPLACSFGRLHGFRTLLFASAETRRRVTGCVLLSSSLDQALHRARLIAKVSTRSVRTQLACNSARCKTSTAGRAPETKGNLLAISETTASNAPQPSLTRACRWHYAPDAQYIACTALLQRKASSVRRARRGRPSR